MKISSLMIVAIALLVPHAAYPQRRVPSVRSVDFANFTYPWPADLIDPTNPKKTFSLRGGRRQPTRDRSGFIDQEGVSLGRVRYSDVTGDGVEEAILYMGIQTGGSAMPGIVYIYTLRGGHPRPLWYFSTGDRADGGLHKVYAENGELVVELYGPQRRWEGDGQLMRFTRRRYVWRSNRFRPKGRKEVIPLRAQSNNGMHPTAK
jgi:hypothetical protein